MATCHPCRTPVEPGAKLTTHGPPVKDPTLYRSLAGALQYLTFTRPDITYAVQQICLFMHDPREQHLHALKRILRYIQGTTDLGLQLYASSPTTLVAYSDADWAGCPTTDALHLVIVCFLETTCYHGRLNDNSHLLDLVLRPSTVVWPTPLQRHAGYGQVRVLHVPSRYQFADIFTKGLPYALFDDFRSSLSVRSTPAPTAGDVRLDIYMDPCNVSG
ncbi:uncharacterized mitochondrial protein AtMg00810-like [Rutidosis leptorrhynchoides]|uniref:uncharacterized mitochondrial protein AtMg00810-like n=1 Tax=Rutidosis leptorrhynchoides TaxID=125765 RepID=UPI003A992F80